MFFSDLLILKKKSKLVFLGVLLFGWLVWLFVGRFSSVVLTLDERVAGANSNLNITGKVVGGKEVYLLQNGKILFSQTVTSEGLFAFVLDDFKSGENIFTVEACKSESRKRCVSHLIKVESGKVFDLDLQTKSEETKPTVQEVKEELYPVTKVIDGDTIKVKVGNKYQTVRLIGIDTPEVNVNPHECFGDEASEYLKSLLSGKKVKLEKDDSQGDKDKYSRWLRFVWLGDLNLGEIMIREGYAYEYTYDKAYKYRDLYKQVEREARDANKGLWGSCVDDKNNSKSEGVLGASTESPTLGVSPNLVPTITIVPSVVNKPTSFEYPTALSTLTPTVEIKNNGGLEGFECDCKKYCSKMLSCDEAYYQLETCGCTKRDADGDGVPCESICPGG